MTETKSLDHPCKHGHFDCSTFPGGPCDDESRAAQVGVIAALTVEHFSKDEDVDDILSVLECWEEAKEMDEQSIRAGIAEGIREMTEASNRKVLS